VEQAEKLINNGNASPVGQESSATADESGENMQSGSDKGFLFNSLDSIEHVCVHSLTH